MKIAMAGMMLIASAALALPRERVTFENVDSNGALGSGANAIRNHEFQGEYFVQRLNITATLQANAAATQPREARIQVTRPNGGTTVIVQPFTSSGAFGTLTASMSMTVNPSIVAGNWQFRFYETFDDGGLGVVDARWTSIRIEIDDSNGPPLVDLGDLGGEAEVHQSLPISGGQVRWVRFTVSMPATMEAQRYLDFDSEGTAITNYDTVMAALYSASGQRIAEDNDDGSNFLSALSFGLTNFVRPAAGNGIPFNSRDGGLPAGEYYLALGAAPMVCNPSNFDVTSSSSATGSVMVNIKGGRYCRADYNNDGAIDFFDYLDFVQEFSSGCVD